MITRSALAFAVVAAITLTACTGDDPTPDTPKPAPATSTSPDPGPKPATGDVPAPDMFGEWGDFSLSGVSYLAVARSCLVTADDAPDTAIAFDVVGGAVNSTLRVELVTQNGIDYHVELEQVAPEGDLPVITGTAEVEGEDMDHTFAVGTFTNGGAFTFSLVIAGAPTC